LASSGDPLGTTLPNRGDALLGALADPAERLVSPLTNLSNCLTCTFAELAGGLSGASANILNRSLSAFANVLDCLAALTDEMASALAGLFSRAANPFEQLGIAVKRGQYPLEDQSDVVEPRLQQSLCLDTLYLQLHLVQAGVSADADLNQVAHLRHDRHLCSQVSDFDVDLIDLDDGDVKKDVGTVGQIVRIDDRVVGELVPRT
jgi:hypothetical protein